MRRWVGFLAVATAIVGVVVTAVLTRRSGDDLTLDSLPEGVSHHEIQGVPVFLARDVEEVVGFVDDAQHLGTERLWWCQKEEVFVSPAHGELFNARGQLIEGPAFRDLDRMSVTVTLGGVVRVHPRNLQRGTVREGRGLEAAGVRPAVWDAYRVWIGATVGSVPSARSTLDYLPPRNNGNFQEVSGSQSAGSPTVETTVCHTVGSA